MELKKKKQLREQIEISAMIARAFQSADDE